MDVPFPCPSFPRMLLPLLKKKKITDQLSNLPGRLSFIFILLGSCRVSSGIVMSPWHLKCPHRPTGWYWAPFRSTLRSWKCRLAIDAEILWFLYSPRAMRVLIHVLLTDCKLFLTQQLLRLSGDTMFAIWRPDKWIYCLLGPYRFKGAMKSFTCCINDEAAEVKPQKHKPPSLAAQLCPLMSPSPSIFHFACLLLFDGSPMTWL